jgi:hypothetical protein
MRLKGFCSRAALSFLTRKGGVALETSMRIAGRLGAGLSPWEALSLAAQVAKADIETIVPFHKLIMSCSSSAWLS